MKYLKMKSDWSTRKEPVSRVSRLSFLRETEEMLNNVYIPYTNAVGEPYSHQEQAIIARIAKLFIRQLWGTLKYRSFSRKKMRCKSVSSKEQTELKNRKTDEIRLKHTRLSMYNPLSKKYKALKAELYRKE